MRYANRTATLIAGLALLALARVGEAQTQARDSAAVKRRSGLVTATPGLYQAGPFARAIFGSGWRDVWVTPVRAPVLDIETYAGGLKLKERGGGFHSFVLHLDEENGWREYRFRSVDKYPEQGMPDAIKGTAVSRIFQDQVNILFPGGPLLVPPLLKSIGALHVDPDLYVMGDSRRLEQVRDTAAGMLGTFELKGEEAPDDKPGFGGATKITGTEGFFEDLLEGRGHVLDEREFLAVRLIDFLVNDPDRTPDNFDWARFGEKGAYTWRPLPRDRDQAFIDARGLINTLVLRRVYPKQIAFGPTMPLKGLTYTSHVLDRRLLQRLTAEDFRDVALRVQRAVTDQVIAQVVAEMPAEWRAQTSADERIETALRSRRDQLVDVTMTFYKNLAGEVDVHGTNEADRFDVVRHADGRVSVTVDGPERPMVAVTRRDDGSIVTTSDGALAGAGDRVYFSRTFLPAETKEIRLYVEGGDDVAVVRGAASGPIKVRLIGGKGDDILADSTGGTGTFLYDAEGKNILVTGKGTTVNTRPWRPLEAETGFRVGGDWKPDWGRSGGWRPVVDYKTGAGLILGVGPRFRQYGFRRLPNHWDAGASLLVGTGNGRLGLVVDAQHHAENSPRSFTLSAQATQLEATRFFGYGNDTPGLGRELNLVEQTVFSFEPSLVWHVGWRAREGGGNALRGEDTVHVGLRPLVGDIRVGSIVSWINPDPAAGSPMLTSGVRGADEFGVAGVRFGVELDRTDDDAVPTRGWNIETDLAAYPPVIGLGNAFGTASARGAMYVPLTQGMGPHLAFRAGGSFAAGEFPVQFAPSIGGKSTLRGYNYRRFAGDAAVNGGAEFRVPVGTVNFLVRSQLGLFALADAGRVWFDGRSDGALHTGIGGGFWLSSLGRAVSVAYAKGESHRLYLKSGLFY
jgi:hypothetical protein